STVGGSRCYLHEVRFEYRRSRIHYYQSKWSLTSDWSKNLFPGRQEIQSPLYWPMPVYKNQNCTGVELFFLAKLPFDPGQYRHIHYSSGNCSQYVNVDNGAHGHGP